MNLHEYCKFSPSDENVKDVNSTSLAHVPLCSGLFGSILLKITRYFFFPNQIIGVNCIKLFQECFIIWNLKLTLICIRMIHQSSRRKIGVIIWYTFLAFLAIVTIESYCHIHKRAFQKRYLRSMYSTWMWYIVRLSFL